MMNVTIILTWYSVMASWLTRTCCSLIQEDVLSPALQQQPYSEATAVLIDAEVRRIVEESHQEADRLLAAHRDTLDALAHALLKAESLNAQEIRDAAGMTDPPAGELRTPAAVPAGA